MRRIVFACLLVLVLSVPAMGMSIKEGFRDIPWGADCDKVFSGDDWTVYKAYPEWEGASRMLTLSFDEKDADKTKYVLHYNRNEETEFEGFSLRTVYYGCGKQNGKFALVIMRYSVTAMDQVSKKMREVLGNPTDSNIVQQIWDLPDIYAQIDQNSLIIYSKKYGQ